MDSSSFWPSSQLPRRAFTPILGNQPSFPPSEFQHVTPSTENHSLEIIRGTSHHMLLASGNPTYLELHTQWIKAVSELDAEKRVNSVLQASSTTYQAALSNRVFDSAMNAPPTTSSRYLPKVENPLSPVRREECPEVRFYTLGDWERYKKERLVAGEVYSKLAFLEDIHGHPVSESRRREMTQVLHECFNELYAARVDPPTWSKKQESAAEYTCQQLLKKCEEFRYCQDGRYKANLFASIKYPDWSRDSRSTGRLKRRQSSGHSLPSIPPPPKRHRKQIAGTGVEVKLEKVDFIDLSHDIDEGNQSDTDIYYNGPSAEASTLSTSVINPSLPEPSSANSTPPMNPVRVTAASQHPRQMAEATTANGADSDSSNKQTHGSPGPVPVTSASDDSNTPTPMAAPLKRRELIKRVPPGAAPIQTAPSPTISIRSGPAKLIRRVNPLAGFKVPSSEVIPPIILPALNKIRAPQTAEPDQGPSVCGAHGPDTPDASRFPPPPRGTATTKKRSPVKPNSSSTARNLYLVDYISYYPDTTAAEYKVVWDSLVLPEVKQEYAQQRKPDAV